MKKRDLLAELTEGFEALKQDREGKITLRKHKYSAPKAIRDIAPSEIVEIRDMFKMSQPVFARKLLINERTLESWEQGRARPNKQAAVLLRLVKRRPETLDMIEGLAAG